MKIQTLLLASLTAAAASAMPRAEIATFTQNGSTVEITYTLTEAPAIVTFDIQTNVTGDVWASIGGENIVGGVTDDSDVFRKVSGKATYSIRWRPNRVWADNNQAAGKVRAVVTALSLDNPPDYMAVDITEQATPNSQRYYPSVDFVPGGVTNCPTYRTSMFLMRRIHARNRTYTMGTFASSRLVTLTNDFYMAVFETTQTQWRQLKGNLPSRFTHEGYRVMRPVEQITYASIRASSNDTYYVECDFPKPPHEKSYLGLLRTRTGIDFDLPGEAQWEYACRAGHGEKEWGNGATYSTDADATVARHLTSAGNKLEPANDCDTTYGTAVCGSYPPNDWGLYDLHGNVSEWCLDWYADDVNIDYHVNVNPGDPSKYYDGSTPSAQRKSRRGGSWYHIIDAARSAARNKDLVITKWGPIGFRVMCPVEAK